MKEMEELGIKPEEIFGIKLVEEHYACWLNDKGELVIPMGETLNKNLLLSNAVKKGVEIFKAWKLSDKIETFNKFYEESSNNLDVKELFGVEIGEEFTIENTEANYICMGCYFDKAKEFHVPSESRLLYRTNAETKKILWKDLLEGNAKIIKAKKPILDEGEKKFLRNLVKPLGIDWIKKIEYSKRQYYIYAHRKTGNTLSLPLFSATSTMYRGMELNREYKVKELEL